MDFRKRIKEVCQIKGITQKDLAEKLGITDVSLNKTLRGEYPQLQSLEKIANALDVPITELFDSTPKEGIIGVVRYNDQSFEINSIEDIRKLLNEIEKSE